MLRRAGGGQRRRCRVCYGLIAGLANPLLVAVFGGYVGSVLLALEGESERRRRALHAQRALYAVAEAILSGPGEERRRWRRLAGVRSMRRTRGAPRR